MKHLERALDNQNQWWKYLVVFLIGLIAANIIGAIPLGVVIVVKMIQAGGQLAPNPANPMDLSAYGIDQNTGLLLLLIPFVVGLITIALLFKPFHQRKFTEVINGTMNIRWKRCFTGLGVWMLIMAIFLAGDYLYKPEAYTLQFDLSAFLPLVIISILLLPIQTTYEEITFRGYLSQGVAAWTRNRLLVIILPSLLFGMMHYFNPEVKAYGFWQTMPSYVMFGLVFGLVTVLDDGIELAMGAHAANNIFMSVMVTAKSSVLQTAAVFEQKTYNPWHENFELLFVSILFVAIMAYLYKWKFGVLLQKVE